jgi:hypothetical protein
MISIDKAEDFMLLNARLIDRLRFQYHFRDGDPGRVIAALRPYQNADGGFGNALEPDLRGAASQPEPVDLAFFLMDEVGAMDNDMVPDALDYLASIARPDHGVPFVLLSALDSPRGPWWQPEENAPGALNPTGAILANLHKNHVKHQWIDEATSFCWRKIDALTETSPYEARAIIAFLEHVPDRPRAQAAWKKVGATMLDAKIIAFDPDAEGKVHSPLAFAPRPNSIARSLFDDDIITRHLDATAAAQDPDGGWRFNFASWTPITEPEWRGWVTVESLLILRDNGRL